MTGVFEFFFWCDIAWAGYIYIRIQAEIRKYDLRLICLQRRQSYVFIQFTILRISRFLNNMAFQYDIKIHIDLVTSHYSIYNCTNITVQIVLCSVYLFKIGM